MIKVMKLQEHQQQYLQSYSYNLLELNSIITNAFLHECWRDVYLHVTDNMMLHSESNQVLLKNTHLWFNISNMSWNMS